MFCRRERKREREGRKETILRCGGNRAVSVAPLPSVMRIPSGYGSLGPPLEFDAQKYKAVYN